MALSIKKTSKFGIYSHANEVQSAPVVTKAATEQTHVTQPTKVSQVHVSTPPASNTPDVETLILSTLQEKEIIADTYKLSIEYAIDHQVIIGAVKSLISDLYVKEGK